MATETTVQEPWGALQPYLKEVYGGAQNLYNTYTPKYFTGQTQAGFTGDQTIAQQGIRDFAKTGAANIMNPAMGAYGYMTGSSILDVAKNPYVSGMAKQAATDTMAALQPELANIRSGAIQSGGYGGSRQGIAQGLALGGAADAANRAAANIYGNAYGQGLTAQNQALGMTGDLLGAGFTPYQELATSGQTQQDYQQALINDAMSKWAFEQNLPYEQLQNYMNFLSGTANLTQGAKTTTSPGQSQSSKNIGYLKDIIGLFS